MTRNETWPKGTVGVVHTHHRGDTESARAVLLHDSPPDQEAVKVRLLEPYYCCEDGEEIETQRYLFKPD